MQMSYTDEILNMSLYTFIAGISGALITFLRKSNEGSVQAKLVGFVTSFFSVLYIVPFILWLLTWKFGNELPIVIERGSAFAVGLMAQYLTETFTNDPANAVLMWNRTLRKIIKNVWSPEIGATTPQTRDKEENDDGK